MRIPAVYSVAGKPGMGKTEFVAELMRGIIGDGGRVGVIVLEQTIQQILLKLTDSLMGTELSDITNREYTDEEKKACEIVAEGLVIYDHITYGSDLETIINNIAYMVRGLGCELIIFDNISYSATGVRGDERRALDQAMIALKDSTVKYNYTLINVCHMKRDDNQLDVVEGDCPVSIEQIRGSQGIEMYSDQVIGLYREKGSDNEKIRNTLHAYILKDRLPPGQDLGKSWKMRYDIKTRRLGD
jgi:replicative DNA helicase